MSFQLYLIPKQVRNERNKIREECRQLRSKVDGAVKEVNTLRREKQDSSADIDTLRKQLELYQNEKEQVSVASSTGSQKSGVSDHEILENALLDKDNDISLTSEQNFLDKLLSKKERDHDSCSEKSEQRSRGKGRKNAVDVVSTASPDDPLVQERVKMLQMKLDEALKTLQGERE